MILKRVEAGAVRPPFGSMEPTYFLPLRAVTAHESNRLAEARRAGPFVAWRDGSRMLKVRALLPGKPITVGRSSESTITFDHVLVSREHAEVLLRVRHQPAETSVFLLDLCSKHGTAHRPLRIENGVERPKQPLRPATSQPARPLRLEPGEHDVKLAGEVWMRVGAVPIDHGATCDRDRDLAKPTKREHDVLVELCRTHFDLANGSAATPSNAEIGALVQPPIGAERVSDLVSQMYAKYELAGTKEQNRVKLVELALEYRLVRSEDYI